MFFFLAMLHMGFLAMLYMGFRATLNFRKFKVALNLGSGKEPALLPRTHAPKHC